MKKADQLFKELLNENLGYIDLKPINQIEATPKADFENKFAAFLAEEAKVEEKKVTKEVEEIADHNFDYKDPKNLDNQIGQEVMNGVYFEAKQNPDKTIDEKKKMSKKAKKESIDTDLAEIDKQAQIVALEAKLDKMDEVIEGKMSRINMVSEDENLSELVDSKKMKAMQKEVKVLEKRKAKMEKMYEKMCGKKYQKEEIVDENESAYAINEGIETLVYQIPNDAPDSALKPYIGKFLTPGNSVNNMVSTAREYEKEGGLFKVGQEIKLEPAVSLSSFGKSLGKPEKAKDDNEKPAEYRDESGKKIKNKDFDINKVSYKLVK
jgi:hypothetical protein